MNDCSTFTLKPTSGCCPLCGGPVKDAGLDYRLDQGVIIKGERVVVLTRREAQIVQCLREHQHRPVRRDALMEAIYGLEGGDDPDWKIVDVYMAKIRKKIAPLGLRIVTLWGRGYMLALETAG